MEKYLGFILIIILTVFSKNVFQAPAILGDSTQSPSETLPIEQPVATKSSFIQKLQDETEIIPKTVIYQDDPETEVGNDKILNEGSDGKKTKIIKISYTKDGNEYSRDIISEEVVQPKDEKILRGTKIVWRTLDSPDGQITYWKRLRVYATHYDSHCPGCDATTAIGLKQGRGVIAVDPSVIPLRSKVYVPGYGPAIAGDTGGAIKGNIIDLGFDDAKTAGWHAQFVDIYLLSL